MKTLKRWLLCLLPLWSLTVVAQEVIIDGETAKQKVIRPWGRDTVDCSRLKFIYEQTEVDTVLGFSQDGFCILEVGRAFSKYNDYNDYRADSLMRTRDWDFTLGEWYAFTNKHLSVFKPDIVCDMKRGKYTVNTNLLMDFCQYSDSTARFVWTIRPDTMTICGYACRKAEATFRGRQWTAWYAPGIPLSIGPWKLNGLPGLIVRADDADGTHHMELVATQKADGEVMDYAVKGRIKMTRERFLQKEKRFCTQGDTYESAVPLPFRDAGGGELPKARRRFYAPYELE